MSQRIKDGGKTLIKCKACNKPIVTLWHTRPDAISPLTGKPFEWRLQAECCYCGGQSYIVDVQGKFHIGGYGIDVNEDTNVEKTSVINHNYQEGEDGVIRIKTAKVCA